MEKGKLMMIIIILLLVVLLGTVVGVSFYVMSLVKNQAAATDVQSTSSNEHVVKNLSQSEITKISLGDAIVTNLIDSPNGTAHFAKMKVLVGYDNTVKTDSEAFATMLTNDLTFARSIALACIRNYTYEDLNASGGDAVLANDIKEKMQDQFNTTLIVDVYFDDWLLQ